MAENKDKNEDDKIKHFYKKDGKWFAGAPLDLSAKRMTAAEYRKRMACQGLYFSKVTQNASAGK